MTECKGMITREWIWRVLFSNLFVDNSILPKTFILLLLIVFFLL